MIPVVGFDLTIDIITIPLIGTFDFGWVAYPLTVLWIVALANLVNLIDGMDALAAGIVAIASFTIALLAVSFLRTDAAALAAIMAGSTLAFLRHNYHPAKVFMGDTGALALGFMLAGIAVEGVTKTAATIALAGPMMVMAVPILDTSFVVLKRLKYRRAPWGADHNHFYHRFLRIGFSQRRTVAYLHIWAALVAAYAILVRFVPPRPQGIWDLGNILIVCAAGLLVIAASVWMVYRLEILKARHLQALGLGRFARGAGGDRRGRGGGRAGAHRRPSSLSQGRASSSSSAGSRWVRAAKRSSPLRRDLDLVGVAEEPQPSLAGEHLVDAAHPALEDRPHGRARAPPPRGSSSPRRRRRGRRRRPGCARRPPARGRSPVAGRGRRSPRPARGSCGSTTVCVSGFWLSRSRTRGRTGFSEPPRYRA